MFIVDFDDTLFDTHAFKRTQLEAVAPYGVTENDYWETYEEAKKTPDGTYTYSNLRHAEMLALRGHDQDQMFNALEKSFEDLSRFLFPDTIPFLEFLKHYDGSLVLLSLGDPAFQEIKVMGSGIHDYFDRLFMVDRSKKEVVEELLRNHHEETFWFINDKVGETLDIIQEFPSVQAILKKSENIAISEYEESSLPFFPTLTKIEEYIRMEGTKV